MNWSAAIQLIVVMAGAVNAVVLIASGYVAQAAFVLIAIAVWLAVVKTTSARRAGARPTDRLRGYSGDSRREVD